MDQIQLTDQEKEIIRSNSKYLKNNDLKNFYRSVGLGCGRITQFLMERGIQVFDYLTEIPSNMFKGAEFETISVPEHIEKIGPNAFSNCDNLKAIDIGDSVKVIGDKAFANCPKLTRVFLPDALRILGSDVFEGCSDNIVLIANKRTGISKLKCKQAEIPWYKDHLFLNEETGQGEE